MDGNGSRSNDDACSKQFNRQRHEGYVKIGISRSYRLNPNFGWKGSAKGHREALHEHLKVIK